MNYIRLFNIITTELLKCQTTAIRHSCDRETPDDNLHCYPGAWNCMQKLMSFVKPTDAEAADLLRFVKHVSAIDTCDLQDLGEYFAEVHDINYSMEEI